MSSSSDDPIQSCQLIGFVGILIQVILAALSFSVLIYKRYKEKPKRAWKIWALDTSKQVVSQTLAHIINVAISIELSMNIESDACIWYLTTNILDNTVGVFLCLGVISLIQKKLFTPNYMRLISGNYYTILNQYEDEKNYGGGMIEGQGMTSLEITHRKTRYAISYFDWLVQFAVWNIIVVISKTVLFYTEMLLGTPIVSIVDFLIGWIQPYQTLQLLLVIVVVPVIMNGLAFWIQDNFLMKKDTTPAPLRPASAGESKKEHRESDMATAEESDAPTLTINEPLL